VVASYTPTLASLLRAQRNSQPTSVSDANIALISASNTSSGSFRALPKVEIEIDLVTGIALSVEASPNTLSQAGATNQEMSTFLESANIVHIACHGTQNAADPLQSAFHLSGDRRLAVSDLMDLDLKHAHLAFLSACETAKGDKEQPDQAIHLAATMLFVGFRSVIGTMW
jgi:CHAT domain-containing protein